MQTAGSDYRVVNSILNPNYTFRLQLEWLQTATYACVCVCVYAYIPDK